MYASIIPPTNNKLVKIPKLRMNFLKTVCHFVLFKISLKEDKLLDIAMEYATISINPNGVT